MAQMMFSIITVSWSFKTKLIIYLLFEVIILLQNSVFKFFFFLVKIFKTLNNLKIKPLCNYFTTAQYIKS